MGDRILCPIFCKPGPRRQRWNELHLLRRWRRGEGKALIFRRIKRGKIGAAQGTEEILQGQRGNQSRGRRRGKRRRLSRTIHRGNGGKIRGCPCPGLTQCVVPSCMYRVTAASQWADLSFISD